jgi:hypothetical protein
VKFYEGCDASGRMILTKEFEDSIQAHYARIGRPCVLPQQRIVANDAAPAPAQRVRGRMPAEPLPRVEPIPLVDAPSGATGWRRDLGRDSSSTRQRAQSFADDGLGAFRDYLDAVHHRFPKTSRVMLDDDTAARLQGRRRV